jgi:hypothetical protein
MSFVTGSIHHGNIFELLVSVLVVAYAENADLTTNYINIPEVAAVQGTKQ